MVSIVVSENPLYQEYESLIYERDQLKKQARGYEDEYTRIFGKLNSALTEEKLNCARKKSALTFCMTAVNRGETIDIKELHEQVKNETDYLRRELNKLIEKYESAQIEGLLTEAAAQKVKETYHRLVKLLHPDMKPELFQIDELKGLWYETVDAYQRNDLPRLTELEFLINKALRQIDIQQPIPEIADIERKIEAIKLEIEEIQLTEPYTLKSFLEDKQAVLDRKAQLIEEIKSYQEYSKKLDEMLKAILPEGTVIKWDQN